MRALTRKEIEVIAGGTTGSTIFVTGSRGGGIGPSGGGGEGGGAGGGTGRMQFGNPPHNGGVAGGAPSIFEVLTEFASAFEDALSDAAAHEAAVGNEFDPADLVAETSFTGPDGNAYQGWAMDDGSLFVDGNGNGIPDMHFRTDVGGNLWENTGGGWLEVGSHG